MNHCGCTTKQGFSNAVNVGDVAHVLDNEQCRWPYLLGLARGLYSDSPSIRKTSEGLMKQFVDALPAVKPHKNVAK